jgi:hypothetical protein
MFHLNNLVFQVLEEHLLKAKVHFLSFNCLSSYIPSHIYEHLKSFTILIKFFFKEPDMVFIVKNLKKSTDVILFFLFLIDFSLELFYWCLISLLLLWFNYKEVKLGCPYYKNRIRRAKLIIFVSRVCKAFCKWLDCFFEMVFCNIKSHSCRFNSIYLIH